jgi:hypothetical protein
MDLRKLQEDQRRLAAEASAIIADAKNGKDLAKAFDKLIEGTEKSLKALREARKMLARGSR